MDPARVARVHTACLGWRSHALSGAHFVALPADIAVAVLDIVAAELRCRMAGIALGQASGDARETAYATLYEASEAVRTSIDRMLDVDAQNQLAELMQRQRSIFTPTRPDHPHA